MITHRLRPRFQVSLPLAPAAVLDRLASRFGEPDCPCSVMASEAHQLVELRVNEEERHLWSPTLSVTVIADESGSGCVVHGLVGPNPNVWTLFAMLYMGLLTMTLFAGILGLVQWTLGLPVWGLGVTAGLVVALGVSYGLSQAGQRLAAPQTAMLRQVLEDALARSSS